jgi:hypothetical protein
MGSEVMQVVPDIRLTAAMLHKLRWVAVCLHSISLFSGRAIGTVTGLHAQPCITRKQQYQACDSDSL